MTPEPVPTLLSTVALLLLALFLFFTGLGAAATILSLLS